ncbi:MAG: DUF4432 family protein [Ruminiclostridium sp.]
MKLSLLRNYFTDKETTIFESGDLSASLFKFETDVEAVRISNAVGYVIILPYKGQQLWESSFHGRILNMYRNHKKAPELINNYFLEASYGVYCFHCGALRMGCPAPDDTHIMHGDLPCAPYENVEILIDEDERGKFFGITGTYTHNTGFNAIYEAHPLLKVYSNSGQMELSMTVNNLSNKPMELMYMAHINYRPVAGSRILQTVPWTPEAMTFREYIPSHFTPSEGYVEMCQELKKNPRLSEYVQADDEIMYDPEVAWYLDGPVTDKEGWVHMMQFHPDGCADFLQYKPIELDHCMRWLTRTPDQQGLALAFPATANVDGYNTEKRLGHVRMIPPKGYYQATMYTGAMTKEEAEKEAAVIEDIMK